MILHLFSIFFSIVYRVFLPITQHSMIILKTEFRSRNHIDESIDVDYLFNCSFGLCDLPLRDWNAAVACALDPWFSMLFCVRYGCSVSSKTFCLSIIRKSDTSLIEDAKIKMWL